MFGMLTLDLRDDQDEKAVQLQSDWQERAVYLHGYLTSNFHEINIFTQNIAVCLKPVIVKFKFRMLV